MKTELVKKFKELDKEIKEALRMFGEYTYFDKGPDEVMFVEKWEQWVKTLSQEDAIAFANYAIEHDHKDKRFETFIDSLNDFLPEEWWEKHEEGQSEPVEIEATDLGSLLDVVVTKPNPENEMNMRDVVITRIERMVNDAQEADSYDILKEQFGINSIDEVKTMGNVELLEVYGELFGFSG